MRTKFDEQLEQLNVALITTGALCEDAISTAAKALLENDMELAKKVKPIELEIDQKEREIENLCMRLLLQQQPVAGDLRQISSALKMITDLERIGDQTSDIAELLPYLQQRGHHLQQGAHQGDGRGHHQDGDRRHRLLRPPRPAPGPPGDGV